MNVSISEVAERMKRLKLDGGPVVVKEIVSKADVGKLHFDLSSSKRKALNIMATQNHVTGILEPAAATKQQPEQQQHCL